MDTQELLKQLEFEYHSILAANYQDEVAPRLLDTRDAPTFYDFLLTRNFTHQQLSAHGISKDTDPTTKWGKVG